MDAHPSAVPFLTAVPCLRAADAATIERIASCCRSMSVRATESIFTQGDPCRSLYILVAGRVKCYRTSAEGREQILKVFDRPGDVFCTTSAFSTGAHIVSAEAMSAATLYAIDVETMKRVVLAQPAVALALVTAAGDQMRSLVGLADDLSLKTATTRLAKFLHEVALAEGVRNGTEVRLRRDRLREEEVASRLGIVRVHVSRSLKKLARAGAIVLSRELIRIPDVARLKQLFEGTDRPD
jgi:CRP/FNR family transcriptional regulator